MSEPNESSPDAESANREEPGGEEDELLGRTLEGRFRIEETIGEGGMGRVYRGCQLSVERDVAIKVLHGELSLDDSLRERFFREAKIVSGFNHPNIVRLIDFGRDEESGLLYLVMELIDGLGLEELLERGRLAPQLALRIAHQTCGALVEAHGGGVIHRDLKAENLILLPVSDGTLQSKVVDFGIAYPQEASKRLTMTGRIYGTASYMAPEQAQGMDVDERADLFSLGVMLFEMLTGHLPVEGTNSIDVMIRQIQQGPPPLSDVMPAGELPAEVFDLVDSLLAIDRVARPTGAAEVRDRLDEIFHHQNWKPIRLPSGVPTEEKFDEWLVDPIEIGGNAAFQPAGSDEPLPSTRAQPIKDEAAAAEVEERQETRKGTGEPVARPGPTADSGEATAAARPANTPADPVGQAADDRADDGRSTLLLVAVGLGLLVLVAVPVVGYLGLQFFRPQSGSPMEEVSRPGVGGGATESGNGEEAGKAARAPGAQEEERLGPETDPVCGRIDRQPVPEAWRATYRPQGEEDSERELIVAAQKLNVRWSSGGATIWIARTDADGDETYTVTCGRYTGSGDGEKCEGTLRRRGPVLIVKFEGADACAEELSGAWLEK